MYSIEWSITPQLVVAVDRAPFHRRRARRPEVTRELTRAEEGLGEALAALDAAAELGTVLRGRGASVRGQFHLGVHAVGDVFEGHGVALVPVGLDVVPQGAVGLQPADLVEDRNSGAGYSRSASGSVATAFRGGGITIPGSPHP
ncbi:hypothetical protein OG552_27400 [Streptomyces sp. NBC_01476]